VSLSQDSVRQLIKERFVAAWINIKDDPAAGSSVRHPTTAQAADMARGLGEHNTQLLVLTPDGKIVDALAGHIGPKDLLEELKFGLTQLDALRKTSAANRSNVLARAHQQFADELAKRTPTPVEQFIGQVKAVGPLRGVADHRFVARHPLLPVQSFTTALMVGNAKSAFVAEVNGDPAMLNRLLPQLPVPASGADPRLPHKP
jgi:hypothetical protein